jgi:two-component system NtrC family sensor kinase
MKAKSIKWELIRNQLIVAAVVLVVSCLAFITNSIFTFERSLIRNANSTAKVLSLNLAPAISFMDYKEAKKIMASLKAEPTVVGAYLYDNNGALQATYGEERLPDFKLADIKKDDVLDITGQYVSLIHPIVVDTESLGVLILRFSKGVLKEEFTSFAIIAVLIFGVGILVSFILASFTQRSLSTPVKALAEFVKEIGQSKDYSLRFQSPSAHRRIPTEIRSLSDEFNQMIIKIQEKDLSIKSANEDLEIKIRERTEELQNLQKVALANARAAGISEIAVGVLHNIGNIINSIGISTEILSDTLKNSKLASMIKVNELLDSHSVDLGSFITTDPRGKALPDFYRKLAMALTEEHKKLKGETKQIVGKIELINSVVRSQQSYAKGQIFSEHLSVRKIVEDLLSMLHSMLARHDVKVIEKFSDVPDIEIDRVKLSHVVVNIIKNAKEAMESKDPKERILEIEIGRGEEGIIFLAISDNGEGISQESLQNIFAHGFTTKSNGHGFGLHFCANSMTEMGGRLMVESKGLGKGAKFTMVFDKKSSIKKEHNELRG